MTVFLYFLPLPQGHGSLRPTVFSARAGFAFYSFCGYPASSSPPVDSDRSGLVSVRAILPNLATPGSCFTHFLHVAACLGASCTGICPSIRIDMKSGYIDLVYHSSQTSSLIPVYRSITDSFCSVAVFCTWMFTHPVHEDFLSASVNWHEVDFEWFHYLF